MSLLKSKSKFLCSKPNPPNNINILTEPNLEHKAIVSWSEVSGATSYTVYRKSSPGVTLDVFDEKRSTTSLSIIFSDMNSPVEYFRVSSHNDCSEGELSTEKAGHIDCILDAPTGLDVQPIQSTNAQTTWNPVSGSTGYHLYRNGQKVWSGTSTTAEFNTPMSGDNFIQVSAQNNCGESDKSISVIYNVPFLFV